MEINSFDIYFSQLCAISGIVSENIEFAKVSCYLFLQAAECDSDVLSAEFCSENADQILMGIFPFSAIIPESSEGHIGEIGQGEKKRHSLLSIFFLPSRMKVLVSLIYELEKYPSIG